MNANKIFLEVISQAPKVQYETYTSEGYKPIMWVCILITMTLLMNIAIKYWRKRQYSLKWLISICLAISATFAFFTSMGRYISAEFRILIPTALPLRFSDYEIQIMQNNAIATPDGRHLIESCTCGPVLEIAHSGKDYYLISVWGFAPAGQVEAENFSRRLVENLSDTVVASLIAKHVMTDPRGNSFRHAWARLMYAESAQRQSEIWRTQIQDLLKATIELNVRNALNGRSDTDSTVPFQRPESSSSRQDGASLECKNLSILLCNAKTSVFYFKGKKVKGHSLYMVRLESKRAFALYGCSLRK